MNRSFLQAKVYSLGHLLAVQSIGAAKMTTTLTNRLYCIVEAVVNPNQSSQNSKFVVSPKTKTVNMHANYLAAKVKQH